MSFSRTAARNVVPLLSRLVLAAAFIPAGWDKIMAEPVVYEGAAAQTLTRLGVGTEVPDAAVAQTPLGFQQPVETGRLTDRFRSDEAEPEAEGGDAEEPAGPAANAADAAGAAGSGRTPAPSPPQQPTRSEAPGAEAASGGATPVRARRLYRVALLLTGKGWPEKLKPGWMAWAAAVTELVGGALILLGLLSRLWGLGLAVTMGFAFYLTSLGALVEHGFLDLPVADSNRLFTQLSLLVLALGVALTGAGRLSIDGLLVGGDEFEDEEHLLQLG